MIIKYEHYYKLIEAPNGDCEIHPYTLLSVDADPDQLMSVVSGDDTHELEMKSIILGLMRKLEKLVDDIKQ